LGVVPDYSYSGDGFKVSSVRSGGVGEQSGMKDGDIIMRMGEIQISDIYGYMEALGEFESGESIIIQVRRSDELVELNVNF
jgi:S1-C subfamily serine protease